MRCENCGTEVENTPGTYSYKTGKCPICNRKLIRQVRNTNTGEPKWKNNTNKQ